MTNPDILEVKGMLLDEQTDMYNDVFVINTSTWQLESFEVVFKYALLKHHYNALYRIKNTQLLHVMCLKPAYNQVDSKTPHYAWYVDPCIRLWVVECIAAIACPRPHYSLHD